LTTLVHGMGCDKEHVMDVAHIGEHGEVEHKEPAFVVGDETKVCGA
jgi:hypothetical protein